LNKWAKFGTAPHSAGAEIQNSASPTRIYVPSFIDVGQVVSEP